MKRKLLSLITVGALAPAACGDDTRPTTGQPRDLTSAEARALAITNSQNMMRELRKAEVWFDDSESVTAFGDVFGTSDEESADPMVPAGGANFLFLPYDDDREFETFLDDLGKLIGERVMADAAVESDTADGVVYRIESARFCDPDWEIYDDCVEVIDEVELRLRVQSFGPDDVDLTLLVGAQKAEAVRFELHHDMGAVTLGVGPILDIVKVFTKGDANTASVEGAGKVRASLRLLSENKVRVTAEVLEDVSLTAHNDGQEIGVSAAKGAVSVDLDGTAKGIVLDADIGALAAWGDKQFLVDFVTESECWGSTVIDENGEETWVEECEEPAEVEGTFRASMGKLAAYVDFGDIERTLGVRGVAAGPFTLALDDKKVAELTVDDGRTFDVEITMPADDSGPERVLVGVSHAIELALFAHMSDALDVWPDYEGTWWADERIAAKIDGTSPKVAFQAAGMTVEAGTVTLTSETRDDVVIAAGECVWRMDSEDDETSQHPFDVEVGATCPVIEDPEASGGESF